jgi:hypothetical protein
VSAWCKCLRYHVKQLKTQPAQNWQYKDIVDTVFRNRPLSVHLRYINKQRSLNDYMFFCYITNLYSILLPFSLCGTYFFILRRTFIYLTDLICTIKLHLFIIKLIKFVKEYIRTILVSVFQNIVTNMNPLFFIHEHYMYSHLLQDKDVTMYLFSCKNNYMNEKQLSSKFTSSLQ